MSARVAVLALALWLLASAAAQATERHYASPEQGRAIVAERDDYIVRMSALERELKAKSATALSEQAYLALLAGQVKAWSGDERAEFERAFARIGPALARFRLPLPPRVTLVRTTGHGEGGAPHTRGTAVVVTDAAFRQSERLPFVLAHELFHVASRHDRRWRDAMYATVGFTAIDEVTLPPSLAARRITNPDAPRLDVAIRVVADGQRTWVMPLLQATVDRYDAARGAEFFATMQLAWLELGGGDAAPSELRVGDPPRLRRTSELEDFVEQVGRNTGYVIHPEEILADNFAQLVTGEPPRSPEVHERISKALLGAAPR